MEKGKYIDMTSDQVSGHMEHHRSELVKAINSGNTLARDHHLKAWTEWKNVYNHNFDEAA